MNGLHTTRRTAAPSIFLMIASQPDPRIVTTGVKLTLLVALLAFVARIAGA